MRPACSADIKAASSITFPRATLIRCAVGFIRANAAASIRFSVKGPAERLFRPFRLSTGRARTGIAHFQVRTPEDFAARLSEADVVVSMLWRNELLAAAKQLKFVQSIRAGMDRYGADRIRAQGIRLAGAAGGVARAVAEHAMPAKTSSVARPF
jgi:phosphoglycerate dehydrogenase-like enzyme